MKIEEKPEIIIGLTHADKVQLNEELAQLDLTDRRSILRKIWMRL